MELLFCFLFAFSMSIGAEELSALLQMLQGASGGGKSLFGSLMGWGVTMSLMWFQSNRALNFS